MLDGLAQRRAHLVLRKRRDSAQQRIADVASGGGRHAQQALGRGVEPGCALQQHVAQAARDLAVPAAGGGEELFGEEGVAFGASDDRVGQRGWRGGIRVSREQRRQLLAPERAEFEQQPRTRAPERRRRAGACARPRRARPRDRSPAAEPGGQRGYGRGKRRDRALRYRPSARPQAPAAPARRRRDRRVARASPQKLAAGNPPLVHRPAAAGQADAALRRTAGRAARSRRDRSTAPAGSGSPPPARVRRARTPAASCQCPLRRRPGRQHRCPPAPLRARA